MLLVIAIIAALPIGWFGLSAILGYTVSPTITGKKVLKKKAHDLGVDIDVIPEAAWNEMVALSIRVAQSISVYDPKKPNWRTVLIRTLDLQAAAIVEAFQLIESPHGAPTYAILRKYRVIEA